MIFNGWLKEYQDKQAAAMLREYVKQHPEMTIAEAGKMLEEFKASFPRVEEWKRKIAAGRKHL